jgi:FAD synthase
MKTAQLLLGRFQPFHNGHLRIVNAMKNPVISVVKGAKSSQDKKVNPFDLDTQLALIKLSVKPTVRVITSPSGYLPDIIKQFADIGINITEVWCGTDRLDTYKKQIDRAGLIDQVDIVEIDRAVDSESATAVRESLAEGNIDKFKKLMPQHTWYMFLQLSDILKNAWTNG